jgi:yecA family protein
MSSELSYEELEEILSETAVPMDGAQAHGILSGLLCADGTLDCARWLAEVFDDGPSGPSAHDRERLQALCEKTRLQLADPDYSFDLLLPDEETELCERAQAVADWCQGFLYGVGYVAGAREWSEESLEVLRDLVEISKLDADVSGEADECAVADVVEFVRMSVYLVRSELEPAAPPRLH